MAILKCKMCGGDLNITAEEKIIECEYCGSTQTVPDGSDEKKTNLFNRANRLRMDNEFDKAAGVYESIVAEFPEDAEGYYDPSPDRRKLYRPLPYRSRNGLRNRKNLLRDPRTLRRHLPFDRGALRWKRFFIPFWSWGFRRRSSSFISPTFI